MNKEATLRSLKMLRQDAIDRGMSDLAIVYGWNAIALGAEILQEKMAEAGLTIK